MGLDRVGIHDDFFELGGHSLLMLKMWSRIKDLFGQNLPIATLFQNRTIEQLAITLRELQRTEAAAACAEDAVGDVIAEPTLVCLDDMAGLLPQYLGDVPIYPLGFWTDEYLIWPYDSLEERTKLYVQRLRQAQLKGPYRLCGSCGSASTAFEMARQLHQQGEEVPLVIMIEPRHVYPNDVERWPSRHMALDAILSCAVPPPLGSVQERGGDRMAAVRPRDDSDVLSRPRRAGTLGPVAVGAIGFLEGPPSLIEGISDLQPRSLSGAGDDDPRRRPFRSRKG